MTERLYTEYPDLYDAIQAEWDYDRDVEFVRELAAERGRDGGTLLEVGCGTGEHACRFDRAGFDVTAVDKHEAMLDRAREKCQVEFRQDTLPALAVEGKFDVVVAIRGVINHLAPSALEPAIAALTERVEPGGLLVFDNSPLPPEGNELALDVGTTETGRYVRLARHVPAGDGTLEWQSLTFTPDGDPIENTRAMTPFEDERIVAALERNGSRVTRRDGYGNGDDRTVFVASRR